MKEMDGQTKFVVNGHTVWRYDVDRYSCTCLIFKKIDRCGHIDNVRRHFERKIGITSPDKEQAKPQPPLSPRPVAPISSAEFGRRKIRDDE